MYYIVTVVLLLCACSCATAQDLPLIDSALAQVGMTYADVRFDQDEMATWGGDRWRLSYFTMLHQNPFKLPKYGAITLEALTGISGNIAALVADAGRKIDCPVRRGLIGYLDDFQGADTYKATMNMSIGSGHDFTIGYLNERAGNDVYLAPGLSLGAGNFQGIGIFHDWAGDDRYTATGGFSVGGARGLHQGARRYLNTFGVFVDGGGNDSYQGSSAANHRRWISLKPDSTKAGPYEIGVGVDR